MKTKKKRNWIVMEWKYLTYPTPKKWQRCAQISGSITGMVGAGFLAVQTIPGFDAFLHDGVKSILAYITLAAGALTYLAQRHIKVIPNETK